MLHIFLPRFFLTDRQFLLQFLDVLLLLRTATSLIFPDSGQSVGILGWG